MISEFNYSDITVGQSCCFEKAVSEDDIIAFCELSGDVNPLHNNVLYAKSHGYNECVVYGMLIASYCSTLAGCYIPGKKCLLHSVEANFLQPVFKGDTLKIIGTVIEKNDLFKQITMKVVMHNQNDIKVFRGLIKAGVLE